MAFSDFNNDVDYLTLQLAFYLASWGMYRGSSELLQKDYLIHEPIVEIIRSNSALRKENIASDDIKPINEIVKKIARKYNATELQILIAFLLNKNVIVIPGSKNIKQIEKNYKARNINISSTDMEILQNEFPAPNHKVELDML